MHWRRKFVEARAFRTVGAAAESSQLGDHVAYPGQLGDLAVEIGDARKRQALYFFIGTAVIAVERQQLTDLLEREPKVPRPIDKPERLDVVSVVVPVAVSRPLRRLNEADLLIKADCLRRHTAAGCRLADRHEPIARHLTPSHSLPAAHRSSLGRPLRRA